MIQRTILLKALNSTIIWLLFCGFLQAQHIIKGTITDIQNNPISFASVLAQKDSLSILSYTYSDDNGFYSLKLNKLENFQLSFSSLGYQTKKIPIQLYDSIKELTMNIVLIEKVNQLKEIIITEEKPITQEGDKITFKAKFFTIGNEQVVEDLLRNIPGINVDKDGTVKIEGKEIEKLLVDGDDLFEKGYKILSKNMPSNPIDKIELLKKFSNNKLLKGIENSNKVALNLVLKEDAKRVWFGNMNLGYGLATKNKYLMKGNLMNFGKKNKYYFLTNMNNIGYDATGDIWQLIQPRFNKGAEIGDDEHLTTLLDLNTYVPNFEESRTNFNNTELLSVNTIFKPTEKIKIKTLGFFNWDENDFFRNSTHIFNTNNSHLINTENFALRKEKFVGFGKIDFTYDVSKSAMLEAITKYNQSTSKSNSDLVFNTQNTREKVTDNTTLFDQKITYTNTFKKHKALLLTTRYINEKTPQKYTINKFFYKDLFSNTIANNVQQSTKNTMQFSGIEAHFLDRKTNGNLLELKFGNTYRKDALTSEFVLKKDQIHVETPNEYQNKTYYATNDLFFKLKYLLKVKNFTITSRLNFHQLLNTLQQKTQKIKQKPFFIVPKIGLEWKVNKTNKLSALYSYTTANTNVVDVYNNYVLTDFRSFSKGSGNFNQLHSSSFTFNYQLGDWGSKFFANTFIMYTKNHDFFGSNTTIAQNYSQSERVLIKDRAMLTISSSIDRYINAISSNFKLTYSYNTSNYKNIVNQQLGEVHANNHNYGFELRSGFSGIFNYHIGTSWSTSNINTTVKSTTTNTISFMDFVFVITNKLNIDLQTERYTFKSSNSKNNTYYFADFNAMYTVKENKLTLLLSAKNLFNTQKFKEFSISDIGTSTTEYRLLPRHILLTLEYRF